MYSSAVRYLFPWFNQVPVVSFCAWIFFHLAALAQDDQILWLSSQLAEPRACDKIKKKAIEKVAGISYERGASIGYIKQAKSFPIKVLRSKFS